MFLRGRGSVRHHSLSRQHGGVGGCFACEWGFGGETDPLNVELRWCFTGLLWNDPTCNQSFKLRVEWLDHGKMECVYAECVTATVRELFYQTSLVQIEMGSFFTTMRQKTQGQQVTSFVLCLPVLLHISPSFKHILYKEEFGGLWKNGSESDHVSDIVKKRKERKNVLTVGTFYCKVISGTLLWTIPF